MTGLLAIVLLQVASNAQLGYRFPVPAGFVDFPAARGQPDVVDCWSEEASGLLLCVQRMHGVLGRDRLKPSDLPATTQLSSQKWKGFDIDVMRTDTAQAGAPVVVYAAQVPLRPEAIQLIVAGPQEQSSRAQEVLTATLNGLEGETNWLSAEERAHRYGVIAGWIVAIAVAALVVRMVARRRAASPA